MGRGNVYLTGSYEGLFYIDNDDLQVWRKDGPDGKEPEIRMMADISLDELVADDWYVDEIESSYKEEDVLRCFCAELRKLCPSFQPAANSNVWLGNERRVILENELFYICVEDTEWYELDIEKFIQGFRLWLENGGDCYGAVSGDGKVDCGEIDAGCADAIIQYALFGDLVFG